MLNSYEFAKRNGTRTSLDIDYRPVLWGLTGKAEGENRFVANDKVTEHLQSSCYALDKICHAVTHEKRTV
ncbi:hypothetical protein [Endozoicomonas sp. SCSIO W0465]|uniref:hypothetical protein n=1 Tax=Endozoicomonas sp. SCSIO W0465 TaxID=2918516 RepID=UPI0020759A1F|nr:hypothetical protein [Endozoicomonas sp. SCSIO W0465]USE36218.1 hypothetical protein MJO57_29970 [Endozoicomonas sp. SCSIO W0465]